MTNDSKPFFAKGNLVMTKPMQTTDEPTTATEVQCWNGDISKENWVLNPALLYLCNFISSGLIGQVVDIFDFSYMGKYFVVVKIIVPVREHVSSFWVFAEELELV